VSERCEKDGVTEEAGRAEAGRAADLSEAISRARARDSRPSRGKKERAARDGCKSGRKRRWPPSSPSSPSLAQHAPGHSWPSWTSPPLLFFVQNVQFSLPS